MKQKQYIQWVEFYEPWIKSMEAAAFAIHDRVNQKYDNVLPYGFHLKLTASYVSKYAHEVVADETDLLILYAAAYLHDCIEDARMSYNDLVRFIREFNPEVQPLSKEMKTRLETEVPEIVYALTNEKGRDRKERANERYYAGIRATRFAPFVKLCDRLANIRYTTLFFFTNRMLEIYQQEHPTFMASIESPAEPLPTAMKQEAQELLKSECYRLSQQVVND